MQGQYVLQSTTTVSYGDTNGGRWVLNENISGQLIIKEVIKREALCLNHEDNHIAKSKAALLWYLKATWILHSILDDILMIL